MHSVKMERKMKLKTNHSKLFFLHLARIINVSSGILILQFIQDFLINT